MRVTKRVTMRVSGKGVSQDLNVPKFVAQCHVNQSDEEWDGVES